MSHRVQTAGSAPVKRRMFRYSLVLTSAAFVAAGIASLWVPAAPASAASLPRGRPAVGTGVLPVDSGPGLLGVPGR
ncbi:hypothetical protein ACFY15_22115 [Streptomyces sp. NPDC001373]|uniref:hypothetical protein n=1 Tax=Streptomyces sp. NPDC001373 TaxID=3364565 RepID=UPI0036800862